MADIKEAKALLLREYERERDELSMLISRLRRELGVETSKASVEPEAAMSQGANGNSGLQTVEAYVKPGDFYSMGQTAAARTFLDRRGERNSASLQDIAQALLRGRAIEAALDRKGLQNLSSMLSKSNDFTSVAKGFWGLSKWYGGKKSKSQDVDDAGAEQEEKDPLE